MPIYQTDEEFLKPLEFDLIYQFHVGNVPVIFGRTIKIETSDPVIFAAAFSEGDLRHDRCGYGASEAEAAVDLFRMCRP